MNLNTLFPKQAELDTVLIDKSEEWDKLQSTIDSLSMAHDNLQRELVNIKRLMGKDKHALIKSNIALNKRVQELEEEVRYLRERENEIININQHRAKYLAEVESRNMLLELDNKRYREALDSMRLHAHYPDIIKDIYKNMEGEE